MATLSEYDENDISTRLYEAMTFIFPIIPDRIRLTSRSLRLLKKSHSDAFHYTYFASNGHDKFMGVDVIEDDTVSEWDMDVPKVRDPHIEYTVTTQSLAYAHAHLSVLGKRSSPSTNELWAALTRRANFPEGFEPC